MSDSTEREMWVVSRGSYSDYRVLCACPTKADAEAVAEKYNLAQPKWNEPADVESFPLFTKDVERVTVLELSTTLWDDGRETDARESSRVEWPFDSMYGTAPISWRWVRAPTHAGNGGRLDVRGTDHERVRKVFSEQRAALIADDAYRSRQSMSR